MTSLKSIESNAATVPQTGSFDSLRSFKSHTRHLLIGLSCSILLVVMALGWFQYQQIDRVTRASLQGRGNLVWDFYKLGSFVESTVIFQAIAKFNLPQ